LTFHKTKSKLLLNWEVERVGSWRDGRGRFFRGIFSGISGGECQFTIGESDRRDAES